MKEDKPRVEPREDGLTIFIGETRLEVDRLIGMRHGFPASVIYAFRGNRQAFFEWDMAYGVGTQRHRFIPKSIRGRGIGSIVMNDAEDFMNRIFEIVDFEFKAMKTENISFALAQGYEFLHETDRELYETAQANGKAWIHGRFSRLALGILGMGTGLHKKIEAPEINSD